MTDFGSIAAPACRNDCSLRYAETCGNTGVRFVGAPYNTWVCESCFERKKDKSGCDDQ